MENLPKVYYVSSLVGEIQKEIEPEFRAFEGDDVPGIQLTIGWDPETGKWDYQTGDNSFFGPVYFYHVWAVVGVYENSNPNELARDILDQLKEYMNQK